MERKIDLSSGSENKPERDYVVISKKVFENLFDLYDEPFADVFRNIYREFFGGEIVWCSDWRTSYHDALWLFIKDTVKRDTDSVVRCHNSDFIK